MRHDQSITNKLYLAILCFCLLLASVGSTVAETSVSIFVATDRHAKYETVTIEEEKPVENPDNHAKKKPTKKMPIYDANGTLIWHNNLTDVLSLVAQDEDAVQPEIVLLGGDNVGDGGDGTKDETGYPMGAPAFSMKAVDAQIAYVFGEDVQGLYTYGSHDTNEVGKYEDVFFSGPIKWNGYWIYGISFAQMIYDNDRQALAADEKGHIYSGKDTVDANGFSAQTASHVFLSWVKSLDDHLPIIVMSHVPLHANRGDNSGSWTWTRALNEASENHDIIFLWGHNHTLEREDEARSIEKAHYLLLPGQTITVQSWDLDGEGRMILRRKVLSTETETGTGKVADEPQKTGESTEPGYELITQDETLRFVYLNAGYLTDGIGSLLTFTDVNDDGLWDELTVKRYTLDKETLIKRIPLTAK
ncbi:MAG: metallophosphoesterase [Lachnospiraceae bacterium]|nr:metallophosphoesterase [Lachnospiraceae bacterium]